MIAYVAVLLMQASPQAPAGPSFRTLSEQAAKARDEHRVDDALRLYKRALRLKPAWEEGLWAAGSIEYDQDKYKECSADFEHLARLHADQAPPYAMAGLCEYHSRDYPAALKSLLEAQHLEAGQQTELTRAARLHLALVLIKLHSYEKAITTLLELTRTNKKTTDIIVAVGIAGLRQPWTPPEVPEEQRNKVFQLGDAMAAVLEQDSKEAMEKFEIVARTYPQDPNVHFRFGAFLMQQDPERGIQEIRKTLELDPEHIPALVSLSAIYRKNGDMQTAKEYAEKALKLDPVDFATHVTLGRALLDSDDAAGALGEFETAVKLAPESPEARLNLANAYARLGRADDAARERKEFQRLRKLSGSNEP